MTPHFDGSVVQYLSPVRLRVLECLLAGKSDAEIARCLGISRKSVKTHIAGIHAITAGDDAARYERRWLVALAYKIGLSRR